VTAELTKAPAAARSLRAGWARLATGPALQGRFDADLVTGLPEPAPRWLTHPVAAGMPLWPTVQLMVRGR
jgi:hypothetical protein